VSESLLGQQLLSRVAKFLGVTNALGDSREGRLALWQVLARTIDQGSRLSATRLAKTHEIDFLELQHFNENSLYANLDWFVKHQEPIEETLYDNRYDKSPCSLFLYDVTSLYFEGERNELAAFGYNRDKKRGKMQIVVGDYFVMVENVFRTCETGQLELRTIYVHKKGRTRAHVFVVMLSYLLLRQLRKS
jgi:hypothetical protein